MNISPGDLVRTLDRFGRRRALAVRRAARPFPHVSTALLLAVASRETNLQNIVGDQGHGRGVFQMDDRWQQAFLRSSPGCANGSYRPRWPNALAKGRVPMLSPAAKRAGQILEDNIAFGIQNDVPSGHRLRFAAAAYNAGPGNALRGWRESRNADKYSTGGDYGRDVLERRRACRRRLEG